MSLFGGERVSIMETLNKIGAKVTEATFFIAHCKSKSQSLGLEL